MNPYVEIILRAVAVYLFIVIAIRLFGKKELTQLSVIDLVFILLISNAVQNAMVGSNSTLEGGIIAAASLFIVNAVLKHYLFKNKKFGRFLQGEPVMLIHEGQPLTVNLKRQDITIDELEAAIREHGVEKIEDVNLAVLEVDGNISVLSQDYHHKTVRKRKAHKLVTKMT